MKEAAGEANLTVVAVVLIGLVVAVATPIIKSLIEQTGAKSTCINDGGTWKQGQCVYNSTN